jgi:hypothetical protein
MRCPECGSFDLRVSADITCRVIREPYVNRPASGETHYDALVPADGADFYWDKDSFTLCQTCGHDGLVRDFDSGAQHG